MPYVYLMPYSQHASPDTHARAEVKADYKTVPASSSGTTAAAGSDDVIPLLSLSMALYFRRSVASAANRVDGLKPGGGHNYDRKTSRQKVCQ